MSNISIPLVGSYLKYTECGSMVLLAIHQGRFIYIEVNLNEIKAMTNFILLKTNGNASDWPFYADSSYTCAGLTVFLLFPFFLINTKDSIICNFC